MKRSLGLILIPLFTLLSFVVRSQQIDILPNGIKTTGKDTIYFSGRFPVLQIDSCLGQLLEDVVEADINASYFDGGRDDIVYTIDFRNHNEYIDMFLWPMRLSKADNFDYFGAVNIKGTIFLCTGNYRSDILFHKTNEPDIKIELQRPKKIGALDKIDKVIFQLIHNISLYGTYVECPGLKIVTSIYIEGRLTDYRIDRKSKASGKENEAPIDSVKSNSDSTLIRYQDAYNELEENITTGKDFKKSVFITENVFFEDKLPYNEFESFIEGLVRLCKEWEKANRLRDYRYKDSNDLLRNLAIYSILKDTVTALGNSGQQYYHLPFTYDFNDFFGRQQWSNMFVSKLLISKRGNCHSFPYLYKILADELGATCWLSLAPNHLYIKNRCKKIGWYNTELTSGEFPIDAWITTSGYIPIKAVQSGLYMDTLSNQQAIALCVLDLAKGYEFQAKNYYDGFIIKCCDLVLQYHPVNAQALLLKAETLKRIYEKQLVEKDSNTSETYNSMEQLYVKLFDLGYREMPEKMYMEWLTSITQKRNKYSNKKIRSTFQQGKTNVK